MSRDPFGSPPARKPVMNQPKGADNSGTKGSYAPSGTSSYEGSPADVARDKAGAAKAGVSMKTWENSAADRKEDAAATSGKGYQNALFPRK